MGVQYPDLGALEFTLVLDIPFTNPLSYLEI